MELLLKQKQLYDVINLLSGGGYEINEKKRNEYKQSFEIRLLERALIEDNCKFIKSFYQVIPSSSEVVTGYEGTRKIINPKQVGTEANQKADSYLKT